jgi:hypothetical protein
MESDSYIGSDQLRRRTKAAILNSRQSKYPVGDDPWVKATLAAVDYVYHQGLLLLTSVGMNTWELTLALASERNIPVIVVLPDAGMARRSTADEVSHRFRLDPANTGFIFVKAISGKGRKSRWSARDEEIIRQADILLPVAIRSDGNLSRMLADHSAQLRDEFIVPYRKMARPRPRYDSFTVNPAMLDGHWLVHFTRSTPGPWPDEAEYDYYHALCRSGSEYCRSAPATLANILRTGVVYGSRRNIRYGGPVVGFTRFSAEKCRSLFRYRPRLVNPYFEPYGIAIREETALDLGLRPVLYGSPEIYPGLPDAEKPYFQNLGSGGGRWKGEDEWRLVGDFHLSRIPADMGKVIVPTVAESRIDNIRSGFSIYGLFV